MSETTPAADVARSDRSDAGDPHPHPQAVPGHHGHRHFEWWHREHPTFTALSGFFTGLAFMCLIPTIFVVTMELFFDWETVSEAFPFAALTLLIPIGLVVWPRTRRFGKYMLLGIAVTAMVVFGVGSFVFWLLMDRGL